MKNRNQVNVRIKKEGDESSSMTQPDLPDTSDMSEEKAINELVKDQTKWILKNAEENKNESAMLLVEKIIEITITNEAKAGDLIKDSL